MEKDHHFFPFIFILKLFKHKVLGRKTIFFSKFEILIVLETNFLFLFLFLLFKIPRIPLEFKALCHSK